MKISFGTKDGYYGLRMWYGYGVDKVKQVFLVCLYTTFQTSIKVIPEVYMNCLPLSYMKRPIIQLHMLSP